MRHGQRGEQGRVTTNVVTTEAGPMEGQKGIEVEPILPEAAGGTSVEENLEIER